MIKLYKYFFDEDHINELSPNKIVSGETRRSLNNTVYNTVIADPTAEDRDDIGYYRFNLELVQLNLRQLSLLNEIKMKVINDEMDSFEFVTPWGESYDVFVPLPFEDNFDVSGEEDNFMVTIVLEERG